MGHHDNEGISGMTKGQGKGKKEPGKGISKKFQGYNTHKAIDCKSQGKGKDSTRWYHGNKGIGEERWSKGIHQGQRQRNEQL